MTTPAAPVVLPPGPDLAALDTFAAALPDDGHRDIAQQLAAALRAHDGQLAALSDACSSARTDLDAATANITTLQGTVTALQATVTDLQAQVTALTPTPTPAPAPPAP